MIYEFLIFWPFSRMVCISLVITDFRCVVEDMEIILLLLVLSGAEIYVGQWNMCEV
jgi:hypothetical protein